MPTQKLTITLMLIAACLGGTKAYIDYSLRLTINTWTQSLATVALIDYHDVTTSLLGAVVIHQVNVTTPDFVPIHIDKITLYRAYQFYYRLPQTIEMSVEGLTIPISDIAVPVPTLMNITGYSPYYVSPKELRGLGYPSVQTDIIITAQFQEDKVLLFGGIDAKKMGQVNLSAHLKNLPPHWTLATILSMQLIEFKLSYINTGLINQLWTLLAQRNGLGDSFKQTLITKLHVDLMKVGVKPDSDILISLQQFIQTPKTLSLILQPPQPIALSILTNPTMSGFFERLGLKMTSTRVIK